MDIHDELERSAAQQAAAEAALQRDAAARNAATAAEREKIQAALNPDRTRGVERFFGGQR